VRDKCFQSKVLPAVSNAVLDSIYTCLSNTCKPRFATVLLQDLSRSISTNNIQLCALLPCLVNKIHLSMQKILLRHLSDVLLTLMDFTEICMASRLHLTTQTVPFMDLSYDAMNDTLYHAMYCFLSLTWGEHQVFSTSLEGFDRLQSGVGSLFNCIKGKGPLRWSKEETNKMWDVILTTCYLPHFRVGHSEFEPLRCIINFAKSRMDCTN